MVEGRPWTPGHWRAVEREGQSWQVLSGDDLVVEIPFGWDEGDDAIIVHDAHLIAAAPALFEALEKVARTIASAGETELYPEVYAALALARGEASHG